MRAAAVPANAGEAGVYATSSTPKSLAALDNDATRKPVALREGEADVKDDNVLMHYARALPHMNVGTATRERAERREMPQMPWPLHQHGRMQK